MASSPNISWDWEGSYLKVKVLYSRAGLATQILVFDDEEQVFLIDSGDGVLRDLTALPDKLYEKISCIVCSHGHFDHIGGLFSLLGFLRMINRTTELPLIFPSGVTEIEGIVRTFKESYTDSIPFEIKYHNSEVNIGKVTITPFPVQHRGSIIGFNELPSIPAFGYIIEKGKERILYTGDTGYFDELSVMINDIDFALIEGTYEEKKTPFHLSIIEARKLGKLAKNYKIIHKRDS
ncbi:MBL fold metallo-hydrolase [Candidatus Heimdallarchaeota archaeon]|nr:MAG: MBL fold metallo-hydrolase [Candidatus Heimdallarchaeota archaeon]